MRNWWSGEAQVTLKKSILGFDSLSYLSHLMQIKESLYPVYNKSQRFDYGDYDVRWGARCFCEKYGNISRLSLSTWLDWLNLLLLQMWPEIAYFEYRKIWTGKRFDRGASKGKRDATDVWRENLAKAAKPLDGAHNAKTRRSNKMTD